LGTREKGLKRNARQDRKFVMTTNTNRESAEVAKTYKGRRAVGRESAAHPAFRIITSLYAAWYYAANQGPYAMQVIWQNDLSIIP